MTEKYQLRHNIRLINSDFQGYRLKNDVLRKVVKQLPQELLTYDLTKMAENSLFRTKLYSKTNLLILDPQNQHVVYYVTTNLSVVAINLLQIALNEDDVYFEEKFNTNLFMQKNIFCSNYISLVFIDRYYAAMNVNETNILLLETGNRTEVTNTPWKVVFNYVIDKELNLTQFQILSGVSRGNEIELALLTCRSEKELDYPNRTRGSEIIVLNFKTESLVWTCERKQIISGKSMPDFVALDAENPGIILIASDDNFSFVTSSEELKSLPVSDDHIEEVNEETNDIQFNENAFFDIEDVDSESTGRVCIVKLDLTTQSITHNIFYLNSRFIGQFWEPAMTQADSSVDNHQVPSICLQCDVDAVVFSYQYTDGTWKHSQTLDAFSYVELSKVKRRFTQISNDCKYGAICDSTSNLMVYNNDVPLSGDVVLTDRRKGHQITCSAELYVASFECGQYVEAMLALPQYVVLLFTNSIVMYLL